MQQLEIELCIARRDFYNLDILYFFNCLFCLLLLLLFVGSFRKENLEPGLQIHSFNQKLFLSAYENLFTQLIAKYIYLKIVFFACKENLC